MHVYTNARTLVHTHPHNPVGGREELLDGFCVALPGFKWHPNISQMKWKCQHTHAALQTTVLAAETVQRPPDQLLVAYFYLRSCQHSTFASSNFT